MTRRAALVLFGLAVCLVSSVGERVGAAPVPKHLMKEAQNPDLDAMQGEWALVGIGVGERSIDSDTVRDMKGTLQVCGNLAGMKAWSREKKIAVATLKLDRTAQTPADHVY